MKKESPKIVTPKKKVSPVKKPQVIEISKKAIKETKPKYDPYASASDS